MTEAILWAERRRRLRDDLALYARLNRLHFAIAYPRRMLPWAYYGNRALDATAIYQIPLTGA